MQLAVAGLMREAEGRKIRRIFSKTYADLSLPVTTLQVNGQMVEFRTVKFQKPTVSPKNSRQTCGNAGI